MNLRDLINTLAVGMLLSGMIMINNSIPGGFGQFFTNGVQSPDTRLFPILGLYLPLAITLWVSLRNQSHRPNRQKLEYFYYVLVGCVILGRISGEICLVSMIAGAIAGLCAGATLNVSYPELKKGFSVLWPEHKVPIDGILGIAGGTLSGAIVTAESGLCASVGLSYWCAYLAYVGMVVCGLSWIVAFGLRFLLPSRMSWQKN